MNLDLQGFKNYDWETPVDGILTHNGRSLTDCETRILVNVALERGYKTSHDIPDELVDEIVNCHGNAEWMRPYDDTPQYLSFPMLERVLRRIERCYNVEWTADDIMDKIREEL